MYQKSWWYDLSFLTYGVWQTEIGNYGSFFAHLLNLPPPSYKNQRNQDFKKLKKIAGDARLLEYRVRQTELFVILGHALLFYLPNNPENQNFEKKKKHLDMPPFYSCVPKITMHASWVMECDKHNLLSFWAIFCPFTPLLISKKKRFGKECLKNLEILSFYFFVTEIKIIWCQGISQKWKTSSV